MADDPNGPWHAYQTQPQPQAQPQSATPTVSGATPITGAGSGGGSTAPDGSDPNGPWHAYQGVPEQPQGGGNLAALGKLAVRAPLSIATGFGDIYQQGKYGLGLASHALFGTEAPEAPTQSVTEATLNDMARRGFDVRMDPDAGAAMQTANAVLPWIIGAATGEVGEIPEAVSGAGALSKMAGLGWWGAKTAAKGTADMMLSDVGQKFGTDVGGPIGGLVGGLAGGTVRQMASPALAIGARALAKPNAADIVKAGEAEGMTTTPGMLVKGGQDIEQLGSRVPLVGNFVAPDVATSVQQHENAARSLAQDVAKQAIAKPASPGDVGQPLVEAGQQAYMNTADQLQRQQANLENQIGTNTPVDATPVMRAYDTAIQTSTSPETEVLEKHRAALQRAIDADNPGNAVIRRDQQTYDAAQQTYAQQQAQHAADMAVYQNYLRTNADPVILRDVPATKTSPGSYEASAYLQNNAQQLRQNIVPLQNALKETGTVTIDPTMPDYAAQKLAQNPPPVAPTPPAIPKPPPVAVTTGMGKMKRLSGAMGDKIETEQGTVTAHDVGNVRDVYRQAIRDTGNQVQPGLGDQWHAASSPYAQFKQIDEPFLQSIAGKKKEIAGKPTQFKKAPGGETIGTKIAKAARGGQQGFIQDANRTLGEGAVAQAVGRDMSSWGYTGEGKRTVKGQSYEPGQYAVTAKNMPQQLQAQLDRQTPVRPGDNATVSQRLKNLTTLGEARSVAPSKDSLTKSIIGAETVGRLGPIVGPVAGVTAALASRALSRPSTARFIARLPGGKLPISPYGLAAQASLGSRIR